MAAKEINAPGGVPTSNSTSLTEDGASSRRRSRRRPKAHLRLCRRESRQLDLSQPQGHAAGIREPEQPALLPSSTRASGASKNIFYTGATTNQQIIPRWTTWGRRKGKTKLFPSAPTTSSAHRQQDHQRPRQAKWHDGRRRGIHFTRQHRLRHHRRQGQELWRRTRGLQHPQRGQQCRLLPGVHQRRPKAATLGPSWCPSPRRVQGTSANIVSQLTAWNYSKPSTPRSTRSSSPTSKKMYGEARHEDPMEAAYTTSAPSLEEHRRRRSPPSPTSRGRRRRQLRRARGARSRSTARTITSPRRHSIGEIHDDGLIYTVWSGGKPIEPGPFLKRLRLDPGL